MSQPVAHEMVWDWLHVLRLEQYSEVFQSAGLTTLQQCRDLTADQLEQMGITLPGHRRRILASLNKTYGNSDQRVQSEKDQRLVETRPAEAFPVVKRPVPIPIEEKPVLKERENKDEGKLRPIPREREKPVPRERQVSRKKEESRDGGEQKPVPLQRQMEPKGGKDDGGGGTDGKKEKPTPKERTRFRPSVPMEYRPSSFSSSTSDISLPPVPPRNTPNCPPQPFTSSLGRLPPAPTPASPVLERQDQVSHSSTSLSSHIPTHLSRPQTLAIHPPTQHLDRDGPQNTSPISPVVSHSIHRNAPPLPPKVGVLSKGPPPIPQCVTAESPTVLSLSSIKIDVNEDHIPQVPSVIGINQTQENANQSVCAEVALTTWSVPQTLSEFIPPSGLDSFSDNSDEYEDPDIYNPGLEQVNMQEKDMSLQVPDETIRRCSLCSDDGLLDDNESAIWQDNGLSKLHGSVYLPTPGRVATAVKDGSSEQTAVIKMGWLDKNPPQGILIYQKRWVKLDADYLRYFNNDKAIYSKGMISTAFITNVSGVGELKFEVVTNNRTFIFRAESDVERNEWVTALQDCIRGRHQLGTMGAGSRLIPDYQGYLEYKGLRSKLYIVVASDKVFLYKCIEDCRIGVGITYIEMNVANIKESDRRSFDLTTPYGLFSFIAETEQLREQWVEAMRNAIGEALSNREVAERIWAEPSNSFCADCGAATPEWAAVNLCVVICKRCAGEHRGLGPSISKVRSLKMDRKVWTEELLQVFLFLGNERANSFWAANVPPSEALTPSSCSEARRRFITNKYRQGKYRKYHPLFGNQKELNNALCINVQCSDLLETLSLIFCGADVNCATGMANWYSPVSLATAHSQPLQVELISHNLNTELPRLEEDMAMHPVHYSESPCVSHNGFLFKTGSMNRAITERKSKEEFSRRWCTLNDGNFSYYDSDKHSTPNGAFKSSEIFCLVVDTPKKHGFDYTFELYSERVYLFGTDDPVSHKEWVQSIAKSFIPATAEPLLKLNFERIGQLKCKDGLNLQSSKVGWFALVGSTLHVFLSNSAQKEEIQLRKLNELSIQQDNGVLVLVEKGRTLYIEGERKLDFASWCGAIQVAAGSGGATLSQQQLTETDIPVIVHSCISYITQCGMTSEGIYRKSGVNSRVASLLVKFRTDARSQCLREGENQVDDVSTALKRFFRELEEGLFTSEDASSWLSTAAIQDESQKLSQYKLLLNKLPHVNKATLQALINHLYCVQCFSESNQMNLHNLAIVFGPTLFQADGQDYNAGRAIEDLIQHYTDIFEVDEAQLKRQLEEITLINQVRNNLHFHRADPGGDFLCTVYLEEKNDSAAQSVRISGSMTAAELSCEVLDRRNIQVDDKDYWSCWEVNEKEEMERPLHYQERVLHLSCETDSYLLIRKHINMEAMIIYLENKVLVSKSGTMKFREERILRSAGFHNRYFILDSKFLKMFKEVRKDRADREWEVKSLKVYLGIKKKLRPPTSWGLTVVCEKSDRQQWYLCCDSQVEMREWYATFLSIQHNGNIWPKDGIKQAQVNRVLPDMRHGNVSLIPLRGSENEMRNSVAAFSQDSLALLKVLP